MQVCNGVMRYYFIVLSYFAYVSLIPDHVVALSKRKLTDNSLLLGSSHRVQSFYVRLQQLSKQLDLH